jgi:hypothetical protein
MEKKIRRVASNPNKNQPLLIQFDQKLEEIAT